MIAVTTRAQWDANAAGLNLAATLAAIEDGLIGMCDPAVTEMVLDEFQAEFTTAFRREDAKACQASCEKYTARFRALVGRKIDV